MDEQCANLGWTNEWTIFKPWIEHAQTTDEPCPNHEWTMSKLQVDHVRTTDAPYSNNKLTMPKLYSLTDGPFLNHAQNTDGPCQHYRLIISKPWTDRG